MPPETTLSAEEVRRVARLARLSIPEAHIEQYRAQLSAVLGYVRRLGEVDLTGVEPMAHVGDEVNRLDADVPGSVLPVEVVVGLAPDTMGPFIKVPKVLDEGGAA